MVILENPICKRQKDELKRKTKRDSIPGYENNLDHNPVKDCDIRPSAAPIGLPPSASLGIYSKAMGTQTAKVSSIKRPQDEYEILVDNYNEPFQHFSLERSDDGSKYIHPLEKLSITEFIDKTVSNVEPVKPPPVETTLFKLVQEVNDLKELAAKLRDANEFAVNLEHTEYRSYLGLTCLMQVSTRTEDFIVDTLKLRHHICVNLVGVFKDPTKRKVMHGADRAIMWLQRDFDIYVCNMFDTQQVLSFNSTPFSFYTLFIRKISKTISASKLLKLERNSLEYLLQHYCEIETNKEYQNADWRLRPLTDGMLRYGREKTHYLLYIYDLMKRKLLSSSTNLVEVYKRSSDLCMQLYDKEIRTENSYLSIPGLAAADLNSRQLAIVAVSRCFLSISCRPLKYYCLFISFLMKCMQGLYKLRDEFARYEDESTDYILTNEILIEVAKKMPDRTIELLQITKSRHPHIESRPGFVLTNISRWMRKAGEFEEAAKKLKEDHIKMMAAREAEASDEGSMATDDQSVEPKKEDEENVMLEVGEESMSLSSTFQTQ
ncbi:hypothetical protein OSB04_027602, partial [Centaurea solstitialis]